MNSTLKKTQTNSHLCDKFKNSLEFQALFFQSRKNRNICPFHTIVLYSLLFLMANIFSLSFSLCLVLQECATDSEELIYPIRAPSSCSAPPDLLLTGDRNKDAKVQTSTPRNDAISADRVLLEVRSDSLNFLLMAETEAKTKANQEALFPESNKYSTMTNMNQ